MADADDLKLADLADLNRALKLADLAYRMKQSRWETPKAIAMIALAVAAITVASRLPDILWPPKPQQFIVHFDQMPIKP